VIGTNLGGSFIFYNVPNVLNAWIHAYIQCDLSVSPWGVKTETGQTNSPESWKSTI